MRKLNRRGALGAAAAVLAAAAGAKAQTAQTAQTAPAVPAAAGPASSPGGASQVASQAAAPPPRRPQFLYVLRVVPRLHDSKAWTDVDNAAVSSHFARLAKATEAGQVILAGRTTEALEQSFGLVVFEAENEAAAREFMRTDPAVAGGQMTATLHPYAVALLRKR